MPSGSYAKNFFVTDGNSLRAETDVLLKDAVAGDEAVNKNPKPDKINANYEAFHAERGASSTLQFNVTSDIATEAELYLYVSSCTNNNASIALKDLYSAYKDGAKITSPNYEATETVALNTNTVTASKSYFEYYGYYIGRVRLAQGANTIKVKHHSPSMDDGGLNGNYLKGIILAGDVDGLTWASGKDPVSEFEPAEPVLSSIEISKYSDTSFRFIEKRCSSISPERISCTIWIASSALFLSIRTPSKYSCVRISASSNFLCAESLITEIIFFLKPPCSTSI